MRFNLHNYYVGKSFDAFNYFGAHLLKSGCRFRVYAPNAKEVALIGEFSNWEPLPMKEKEESGVWELKTAKAKKGQMYKYRIYFEDGNYCDHSDPFAFSSQLRPDSASIIADLDFQFTDDKWLENRDLNYNRPMNIYEVHLSSFRRHWDGSFYSYTEIADDLINYVKEHHYTHVEFMPLTEYPSDSSWGYQVLGFYSATSRYGRPEELMELINKMHNNGIGVILDFVPVHFALDYYGLAKFDGSALYEYDHDVGYSEWGTHNFNYYRGEVRSFLQSAVNFWIEKYHIDGIRMDAISNALYWQGDNGRGVNDGAVEFIKEMNLGLKDLHPDVMKIAEDSTDYLKVTAPVEYDGLGFDYKWDLGWMNDTLEFFKFNKFDRGGYIGKIQWSMFYFYNELFILPFSHDEVVHGKGSILNKLEGSYEEKFLQARLLYLYMMTHPGKKLNFMGNEFAHFDEWTEQKEIDWMLLDYPMHRDFLTYITNLNKLYLDTPALYQNDYNPQKYYGLETSRLEVLAYMREANGERIITILNFGGYDLRDVKISLPIPGKLDVLFKTDEALYFAPRTETQVEYLDNEYKENDKFYILVDLFAFSGMILKIKDTSEEFYKANPKITKESAPEDAKSEDKEDKEKKEDN